MCLNLQSKAVCEVADCKVCACLPTNCAAFSASVSPTPFFRDFCLGVPHLFFGSLSFSVSHSFFRTLPFQGLSPLLRLLFFGVSYSLFRTLPLKWPLHLLRIRSFSVSHPFPPFKCPPPLFRTLSFRVSCSSFRTLSFHCPSPLFQNPPLSRPLNSFPEPSFFNVAHLPFFPLSKTLPFLCSPILSHSYPKCIP